MNIEAFDHIAIAVPDLDTFVKRLLDMGMVVRARTDKYALLADASSGFKIELNVSEGPAQFRHLGFRTPDVDSTYDQLTAAGMAVVEKPHRREFAKMRTAFLKESNGIEMQLVKYD
jgi:catechol 2,3-dioxygenase-like lactoylglutathione lyase family enzyme